MRLVARLALDLGLVQVVALLALGVLWTTGWDRVLAVALLLPGLLIAGRNAVRVVRSLRPI